MSKVEKAATAIVGVLKKNKVEGVSIVTDGKEMVMSGNAASVSMEVTLVAHLICTLAKKSEVTATELSAEISGIVAFMEGVRRNDESEAGEESA